MTCSLIEEFEICLMSNWIQSQALFIVLLNIREFDLTLYLYCRERMCLTCTATHPGIRDCEGVMISLRFITASVFHLYLYRPQVS